jgi:GT2 family glycosyltransferase
MEKCLNSLRQVQYPKDKVEIIVVDNASTDGSIEYLKNENDVILIENKENVGFAAGVNQGVEKSSYDYVALLNNDMKVDVLWLK